MPAALTLDLSTASSFEVTLTQSASSVTLSNPGKGQIFTIIFIQNDAGGYTVSSWPANVKFAGGSAPTQSVGSGAHDSVTLEYDGTNYRELSRSDATLLAGRRLGLSGWPTPMCWPGFGLSSGTILMASNTAYLNRLLPDEAVSLSKIGWVVTIAAGSNDSVQVGLIDQTGTLVASSTSAGTAGLVNSTGFKTLAFATAFTVKPGVPYYAVLAYGTPGGTAATLAGLNMGQGTFLTVFGANVPNQISGNIGTYPINNTTNFYSVFAAGQVPPALFAME